jgi:hypothetical protein
MAIPTYKGTRRGEISFDGQYEWTGYGWNPVSSFGSGGMNSMSMGGAFSQSLPTTPQPAFNNTFGIADANITDLNTNDGRNFSISAEEALDKIAQNNPLPVGPISALQAPISQPAPIVPIVNPALNGFNQLGIGNIGKLNDYIDLDFGDLDFSGLSFPTIPIHFTFSLTWASDPNITFDVSNNGKTKTTWSSSDFTQTKTFTAKAGGYGISTDKFQISTQTNPDVTNTAGGNLYEVVIRNNGGIVKTIRQGKSGASFKGIYKFKKEEIIPDIPKGILVDIDLEAPDNVTANVTLNPIDRTTGADKSTSISGKGKAGETGGELVDDNSIGSALSVTLSGTDSTCNYQYELFNIGGGLLSSGNDKSFSQPLAVGKYKLKVVVSKTAVPDPPKDTPTYKYRRETYYVPSTETRGTTAAGPKDVSTTAQLEGDSNIIYFGEGQPNGDDITIRFGSTNASYVNFTFGDTISKQNTSGVVTINQSELFNGNGNYTAYFQAVSDTDGSGNIVPIKFRAERKDLLPGPDIISIEYPQVITGKDYQGYNVDFEISWTSINTNYVDIYINEVIDKYKLASKRPADGVQSFNIKDVLKKAGNSLDEDLDVATFVLKLIPYNEEGDSKTEGKTETIQINFDKGNIKLRRDVVLRDIKETLCSMFDTDILKGDSSKYLTHLMHFGEANNKVIASWDTDFETFSKYEFSEDTGERTKVSEEKTLVFKLYEPLPREVQPNEQIWVSKIQSIPYVEQITIINEEFEDCIELSPNFGTGVCGGENIGYQLYDDLIASGSSSSTKLLTEYVSGSGFDLKKLTIPFVSSSKEVSGSLLVETDSTWAWNNFVKYSSANERVNNFIYKIKLIEFYEDKIQKLESGSFNTGSVTLQNEINRTSESVQEVKDNFDAFETFLFTSSSADGLTYPGAGGNLISASDSSDATDWYNSVSYNAQNYDLYNKDYLVNNLPLHIQNSEDSEEFKMFFNMMGHHFDVLYLYTKAIAEKKNLEHKYDVGINDSLLSQMLESLGWDTKVPAKAQSLWEYAFGETSDGTSVSNLTGKEIQNQVWRRLLNNIPYLLKHKGSSRAVKAALACYGVPSSMLTIMEFGGPRNADGGVSKFSFEDRTAALNISGSESVLVPWKQYSGTSDYPNAVEIRVNSDKRQDQTFVTSSLWNVGVQHTNGTNGVLTLTVADSSSAYMVTSSAFPFFNDEYTQIVVEKSNNTFTVKGKEAFQGRIRSEVSASIEVENHIWQTETTLKIGDGSTFTGSIDEFRYWTYPLSESRVDNHTLMPDAIDGNHHSSSTEDLLLRLDFEYPKDRNVDTAIKNVSINESYLVPFVTASNFDSNSSYPYHYTTYERTVTANVPSSGFNVSQKFRFEEQQGLSEDIENGLTLSYRDRSTKKSFDTSPIDTNKLGLFFSPVKEVNMDILKSIGQFELDQYIGDPSDEYKYEYKELRELRNYYFERYNLNLYEYIQLVRYIDQSLFEVLESLVPARAIVTSGLLIEPHILERNKVKRTKPTAVEFGSKFQDSEIDLREAMQLAMIPITQWPADIQLKERIKLAGLQNQYDSVIASSNPTFKGNYANIIGRLNNLTPTFVSTYDLIDGTITDSKIVDKLLKQFEAIGAQDQIGISPDSLTNGLAGITAVNGYAVITKLDGNGTLIKETKQVYLVTEEFEISEPIQVDSNDASLGETTQKVTKTRKYIVFAEVGRFTSGPRTGELFGPKIGERGKLGGTITAVERVNASGGKRAGVGTLGSKYGNRGFKSPSRQTSLTTLDGKSPIETFCTNPNILKVSDTGRGAGEPILEVDVK